MFLTTLFSRFFFSFYVFFLAFVDMMRSFYLVYLLFIIFLVCLYDSALIINNKLKCFYSIWNCDIYFPCATHKGILCSGIICNHRGAAHQCFSPLYTVGPSGITRHPTCLPDMSPIIMSLHLGRCGIATYEEQRLFLLQWKVFFLVVLLLTYIEMHMHITSFQKK